MLSVPQDFVLIATLEDASDEVRCLAWRGRLLASGGDDWTVRVYDEAKDFPNYSIDFDCVVDF